VPTRAVLSETKPSTVLKLDTRNINNYFVFKTVNTRLIMVQTHPAELAVAAPLCNGDDEDDEFHDAEETVNEKMEHLNMEDGLTNGDIKEEDFDLDELNRSIEELTTQQLNHALASIEDHGGKPWKLFSKDGDMKLYLREDEVDGHVVDPLKSYHVVPGVTGREMCHYFYQPEFRMSWEISLDSFEMVRLIDDNTCIFHNIHKRVWPTTQRDSVFWSHLKQVDNPKEGGSDIWMVTNRTCNHPPAVGKGMIRVNMTVSLVCETVIAEGVAADDIKREDVSCHLVYCSAVHPGGWAPTPLLRTMYKREYPRFLKRFTKYVKEQCAGKDLML